MVTQRTGPGPSHGAICALNRRSQTAAGAGAGPTRDGRCHPRCAGGLRRASWSPTAGATRVAPAACVALRDRRPGASAEGAPAARGAAV